VKRAAFLPVVFLAVLLTWGAARADAQTPLDLDLPAGPLAAGLSRVAAQAGLGFAVEESLVAGLHHPALRGRYTPREAFEQLLQGTDLALVRDGAALTLQRRADPLDRTPATLLPEVRVQADGGGEDGAYHHPVAQQALRGEAATLDIPQAVTVLPAGFIRDQAPQSLSELLRYAPGLGSAQGEGNRDTPVFRGNLSTADFLLDGMRDDVQYYRDLYNIERVEALRGPNAAAVGHGAAGGLINRISKQPRWAAASRFTLQAGSEQTRRATLDLDRPLGPTLAARLNLLAEDSGGYRDDFHLRRAGINPVLAWRAGADTLLSLGFEHFHDRRTADRGVPSYLGRPLDVDPAAFFGNPDISTTRADVDALNLQLDRDLGDGLTLQAKTRLARYEKFFQNAFPGSIRAGDDGLEVALLAHNSRMLRRNAFQQIDLSGRAGPHQWLAGLELGRQAGSNRRETGYFMTPEPVTTLWAPLERPVSTLPVDFRRRASDPDNDSVLDALALHLQGQIQLGPHWQATLGLRRDDLRLDVDDRQLGQRLASRDRLWSPRAGLLWRPAPEWTAYANYSLGYALRAGEQFTLLTPATQGLAPERFINREAGLKWAPAPQLEASATVYLLDRHDVAVPDPQAPTERVLLVAGQRTRGLELSLAGRLAPGWQLLASYAWQDSRIRESLSAAAPAGNAMPHVPRHGASLWSRWTLDARWAVALALTGRSGLYASTDNRVVLPGYVRWDGALFLTPAPGWRLQLNLENLLDRRYTAFAHNNNNLTPGAPRSARLSAQWDF